MVPARQVIKDVAHRSTRPGPDAERSPEHACDRHERHRQGTVLEPGSHPQADPVAGPGPSNVPCEPAQLRKHRTQWLNPVNVHPMAVCASPMTAAERSVPTCGTGSRMRRPTRRMLGGDNHRRSSCAPSRRVGPGPRLVAAARGKRSSGRPRARPAEGSTTSTCRGGQIRRSSCTRGGRVLRGRRERLRHEHHRSGRQDTASSTRAAWSTYARAPPTSCGPLRGRWSSGAQARSTRTWGRLPHLRRQRASQGSAATTATGRACWCRSSPTTPGWSSGSVRARSRRT